MPLITKNDSSKLTLELENHSFLKLTLLLASMITMMSGAIVSPSIPKIATVFSEVEGIALLSRLIITIPALFVAFSSPVFGALSDKLGRKKILLISLLLYAISGSSGYMLDNVYLLLIGRIFLGISVGGINTIITTLIGDYFSGNERNKFAGMQGAFMSMGGVVFISLAGWLSDLNWQSPFLIYLFALPVFILAGLYIYEPQAIKHKETRNESPKYNRKLTFVIYLLAFLGIVFFYMIPIQIPFLINNFDNASSSQIGYAIGIATLSGAIVSSYYKRLKAIFSFKAIFQIAFLLMGIGYIIVSFSTTYIHVLIGLLIAGMGTGLLMPSSNLWIMNIAPENMRGTLVGRISMVTYLGQFFSPILIQPIINNHNIGFAFLIASSCLGGLCMVLFWLISSE